MAHAYEMQGAGGGTPPERREPDQGAGDPASGGTTGPNDGQPTPPAPASPPPLAPLRPLPPLPSADRLDAEAKANAPFTRDELRGNRCRSVGARMGALREAMLRAVKPADAIEVLERVRRLAVAGNIQAARVFFERVLGRPVEADLQLRLEALERHLGVGGPSHALAGLDDEDEAEGDAQVEAGAAG